MFDNEDDELNESELNEDIVRFENYLKGGSMGFVDSDRLELLIDHYLMIGHYHKANEACDFALHQFPYNSSFVIRKAQSMSALGYLKEALNLLATIEKIDVTPELFLTKASIFSQLRDHKTSIKCFNEAIKLMDASFEQDEVYVDLSSEYQALGDYKNAIKALKEAQKINPKNESAIYEMAFCYDQLGDFENSINCYKDYIDENPYSFTAWYNLGNIYSKLEKHDEAIDAYSYSIAITDEFAPVFFNLGNAYMNKEMYIQALESFQSSLRLDENDPLTLCYIGECYEQMGNIDMAERFYRESVDIAPLLPDAWLGLGIVLDLKGQTREGIRLILKALELDPMNAGIHQVLATAYEKIEDIENALDNYETSLGIESSDEECLRGYVSLLMKIDPLQDTLAFLDEFEEEIGKNDSIRLLKVVVLWKLGRKQEAISQFVSCIEIDKEHAKEIFDIEPSFKSEKEFIQLLDL
jgi:tetratricopeptide (TPR) repeat protein